MSDNSSLLALPLILPDQAQKHVTHNEALELLDVLVQLVVEDFDAITPPTTAAEGAVWALGGAPVEAWAGQALRLASWRGGAWIFINPGTGWRAWGRATGALRVFTGSGWAGLPGAGDLQNLAGLGISATSDDTNRLAVSSSATLLSHAGAGHQLKINKAAVSDTASLLFQSGWSGRAEMGLTGSDDFAIKVSADGSSFATALSVAAASGAVTAPAGLGLADGTAVNPGLRFAADEDTGVYRLGANQLGVTIGGANALTVNATDGLLIQGSRAYRRADILGPVSQTAGIATGAVIESGANADGAYVRFADGTMRCMHSGLSAAEANTADGSIYRSADLSWTFPSGFIAAPVVTGAVDDIDCWISVAPTTATATVRVKSSVAKAATLAIRLVAQGRWF